MLIDTDFLDHWRTRMLIDLLDDKTAPFCIMRLWSHCQIRKADRFELTAHALKMVCRYEGDPDLFERAMIESGWISRDGTDVVAVGWAERNAGLITAWENGKKGGRPKKEPKGNPRVTDGKPTGNPRQTQAKPIRLDETGLDETRQESAAPPAPPSKKITPVEWTPTAGFTVTPERMTLWAKTYPGVDIASELRKANLWLIENPRKQKKDYARFVSGWLGRVTPKTGGSPNGGAPRMLSDAEAIEKIRREREARAKNRQPSLADIIAGDDSREAAGLAVSDARSS